jgi:hypothetical protein
MRSTIISGVLGSVCLLALSACVVQPEPVAVVPGPVYVAPGPIVGPPVVVGPRGRYYRRHWGGPGWRGHYVRRRHWR